VENSRDIQDVGKILKGDQPVLSIEITKEFLFAAPGAMPTRMPTSAE
jgi:hypothetical protein